jgi:hypothetical protein
MVVLAHGATQLRGYWRCAEITHIVEVSITADVRSRSYKHCNEPSDVLEAGHVQSLSHHTNSGCLAAGFLESR